MLRISLFLLPTTATAAPPTTSPHLLYRGIHPTPLPNSTSDQHRRPVKIAGLSGITYAGAVAHS
ncbi:MAG TPA: hypothetical protein VF669_13505, partial [Tepidisphaeraceae bacterium]